MTTRQLSIVMPAYNEGDKIYENIKKVYLAVSAFCDSFEIIAVNDGSKDNTAEEVKKAAREIPGVRLVSYKKNRGKGGAIKAGVKRAEGQYIAFLDADLDLPPEQLRDYMRPLEEDRADVVIGSKMHKDSKIDYPFIRKVISVGYYLMLKLLFHLNVKDTQTGIKIFKAEVLKPVIDLIRTDGFAYDIEILIAVNSRHYRIMEMPVQLVFTRENGMGRIHLKDIWKAFRDTWKIFWRARIKKVYR